MFDEVTVAVDDDEAALDGLALGRTLGPVAAFTETIGIAYDGSLAGEQALKAARRRAPLALWLAHHAPCPVLVVAKPMPVASDDR